MIPTAYVFFVGIAVLLVFIGGYAAGYQQRGINDAKKGVSLLVKADTAVDDGSVTFARSQAYLWLDERDARVLREVMKGKS